jgi:hypothetical protein
MLPDKHRAGPHQEEHDRRNPASVRSDGATLDEVVTHTNVCDLKCQLGGSLWGPR